MERLALTRASELIHVTDTLEALGESPERLLRQAKLPMWHYCDPDDLIPDHHIRMLLDRAARSLGDPIFGLRVGTRNGLAAMGSWGRLVAGSLTTHHAFQTTCRLIRLQTSGGHYWMAETAGEEVWFCGSRILGPEAGRREREQYALTRMIDHVRLGAGPTWRPAKVRLQAPEAPEPALREALGDPQIFVGQRITGIAVPRALLAQPLRRADAPGQAWRDEQESRLRISSPSASFADTLRQLAGTLLKEGHPRIEMMAEIVGLSVRSLQRRLAAEGVNHSQIVDQARYEAATRLLEDSDIRMTDIAMELGYADSAHFTRAFKRWAGVTPRQYRAYKRFEPRATASTAGLRGGDASASTAY